MLSGPTGTVQADGLAATYSEVAAAQSALSRWDGANHCGRVAIRCHRGRRTACSDHAAAQHTATHLADWRRFPGASRPSHNRRAEVHRQRVARAIERLREPGASLHKVVLARALRVSAESPWDGRTVLGRLLAADPAAYGYLVDLSPAGGDYTGTMLVGASPELLVARDGDRVICRPFAGSAPRSSDPAIDRANGQALTESGKNRHEHQLVIDTLRQALDPLCVDLQIAPEPELHGTDALWHLSTPVTGRLRETDTTAMDLALALHPTPAVGGAPTAEATALIDELEGDRGFYAGAVGWCDASGDGRWVVSIRCAQLSADRRTALAHSGGGIVAESDAEDEVAETTTKFRTILSGLGVKL